MSRRNRKKQKKANKAKVRVKASKKVIHLYDDKTLVPKQIGFTGKPGNGTGPVITNVATVNTSNFAATCHSQHPILNIGGGKILGASCLNPEDGFDIYIGLDFSMTFQHSTYPWGEKDKPSVVEFLYKITDYTAPVDVVNFKCMIAWMAAELKKGKSIHVGCIGGHGRTGLVLAALVKFVDGTKDAITWIRENYCDSAVESNEQINFLHKYYGIKKVVGTKAAWVGTTSGYGVNAHGGWGSQTSYTPIACPSNIFGI